MRCASGLEHALILEGTGYPARKDNNLVPHCPSLCHFAPSFLSPPNPTLFLCPIHLLLSSISPTALTQKCTSKPLATTFPHSFLASAWISVRSALGPQSSEDLRSHKARKAIQRALDSVCIFVRLSRILGPL